jgi:hypothetical protein
MMQPDKPKETTMTDTVNTQPASSNSPSHIAYQVRERKGQKSIFARIGAAWPNKNGTGFNIQLDAVPLSGRITLLLPSEKAE